MTESVSVLAQLVEALADESTPYPGDERWTVVKAETLRALVDAVERPSREFCACGHSFTAHRNGLIGPCRTDGCDCVTFTDPAPAASPSEPLCRCGHKVHGYKPVGEGGMAYNGCQTYGCPCTRFEPNAAPPRPSISDEAEAAWEAFRRNCYLDPEIDTPATQRAWVAGYRARAARGEEA